jgi:hypothetical protein
LLSLLLLMMLMMVSLLLLLSLRALRELHLATCEELGVEPAVRVEIERLLNELQQLLIGIAIMQDLTARAKDSLVSFGERMSTRIFASYLRAQVGGWRDRGDNMWLHKSVQVWVLAPRAQPCPHRPRHFLVFPVL